MPVIFSEYFKTDFIKSWCNLLQRKKISKKLLNPHEITLGYNPYKYKIIHIYFNTDICISISILTIVCWTLCMLPSLLFGNWPIVKVFFLPHCYQWQGTKNHRETSPPKGTDSLSQLPSCKEINGVTRADLYLVFSVFPFPETIPGDHALYMW